MRRRWILMFLSCLAFAFGFRQEVASNPDVRNHTVPDCVANKEIILSDLGDYGFFC